MMNTKAFTSAQLRDLRSEMERELAWLLRSLTSKQTTHGSSANGDSNTAPFEHSEMERLLRDRAQNRLAAIVAALGRLDSGTYGECISCHRPIAYGRLAAMPEATHCIACGRHGGMMQAHYAALGSVQPGGVA